MKRPALILTLAVLALASCSVQSSTTGSATSPASSASEGSYSGNGIRNLGTVRVASQSTLQWSCQCQSISIISAVPMDGSHPPIAVTSRTTSGSSSVDAGTYNDVQVLSDGTWQLTLRAASR